MDGFSYDLVIAGGGVAATHTLLRLLDEAADRKLRIAVIDDSPDLWRGLPYGGRSSINSLTITDLNEFLPPFESIAFTDWLSANWERLAQEISSEGGAVGSSWLKRHAREIEQRAWGSLYVPRRFYGEFLSEKTRDRLERSKCRVDTFMAAVRSIAKAGPGFDVIMQQGDEQKTFRAKRILLAVGSPPVQRIAAGAAPDAQALVIEDIYAPSLDENLAKLTAHFERLPQQDRRLLILGSNATSLELTYMLNWSPVLRRMLEQIVILSGGGRLPERIGPPQADYRRTPALDALDGSPALSAAGIFEASRCDIAELVRSCGPDGCDFSVVSERLVQILSQADEAEIRHFHHAYGLQFTRLIRRAGSDYRDAAQSLIDDGKLELCAGRLEDLSFGVEGVTVHGVDAEGAPLALGAPFAMVVNCSGFEPLSAVSHPLLSQMLESGLVAMNVTKRGFAIDENFRAGEHVFVAGPLLAGVFNEAARFWHVENVRRIAELAPHIANAIARDLEA